MSIAENKALVERFIEEVFNKGNVNAIADFCVPGSMFAGGVVGQIRSLKTFLPDGQFTIDSLIAEGDKVVAVITQRGTNTGPIVGLPAFGKLETPVPPTGKAVAVSSVSIFTLSGSKIKSYENHIDQISLLQQLGWTIEPPG